MGLLVLGAGCAEDLPSEQLGADAGSPDDPGDPDPGDSEDPEDPGDPGDPDPGDPGNGAIASFVCPDDTAPIVEGANTVVVNGVERTFYAAFPADPGQQMGILFSWHGYGDSAENFRTVDLDPDADPALPVVVITPEDSGLQPFDGLDWDIRSGLPDYENVDFAFFEAMVACLVEQHPIDETRISSFGFSAGSVMTSLLHSRYPKVFSAVIAASGVWFNDPAQADLVNDLINVDWEWPALDPGDGGAVLVTHGGPSDVINIVVPIIDLEAAAQAALPFLTGAGRVVIDCAHGNGHALHPELSSQVISRFLSAHRAGEPSPYLDGELEGFPASCTLLTP